MEIKNVIINTRDMSIEEMDALIRNLKRLSNRKREARARNVDLRAMVTNMKDDNFVFCNRHTGEIFNPDDWVVYDELTHEGYPVYEGEG